MRLWFKAIDSRTRGAARLLPLQIGSKREAEEDWGHATLPATARARTGHTQR